MKKGWGHYVGASNACNLNKIHLFFFLCFDRLSPGFSAPKKQSNYCLSD